MSKNILIACYSYTGNTYRIARAIRDLSGGVLCVLYPRQPYPMQFQALLEQVRSEVKNGILPRLLPGLQRTDAFDAVFIGTPIWCSTLAPPASSFLAENNLEGKTVVPFYSHCGGWTGSLVEDVQRLAPNAHVEKDFGLLNGGGDALYAKVSVWLDSLGLLK